MKKLLIVIVAATLGCSLAAYTMTRKPTIENKLVYPLDRQIKDLERKLNKTTDPVEKDLIEVRIAQLKEEEEIRRIEKADQVKPKSKTKSKKSIFSKQIYY